MFNAAFWARINYQPYTGAPGEDPETDQCVAQRYLSLAASTRFTGDVEVSDLARSLASQRMGDS